MGAEAAGTVGGATEEVTAEEDVAAETAAVTKERFKNKFRLSKTGAERRFGY
jgi:hypothetical protein